MAILPLLVIAAVGVAFAPKVLRGLKARRAQRALAKTEREDASVTQSEVDVSAQSRLRRITRTVEIDVDSDVDSDSDVEIGVDGDGSDCAESFDFDAQGNDELADASGQMPPTMSSTNQPPVDEPWQWLLGEGPAACLRPAAQTGFPWVAATIAEMSSAYVDHCQTEQAGRFLHEAEAWLALSSELLPTQAITGGDAESFVSWLNDAVAHSNQAGHQTGSAVTMPTLLAQAMDRLSERGQDDSALAAALPIAFHNDRAFSEVWAKAS